MHVLFRMGYEFNNGSKCQLQSMLRTAVPFSSFQISLQAEKTYQQQQFAEKKQDTDRRRVFAPHWGQSMSQLCYTRSIIPPESRCFKSHVQVFMSLHRTVTIWVFHVVSMAAQKATGRRLSTITSVFAIKTRKIWSSISIKLCLIREGSTRRMWRNKWLQQYLELRNVIKPCRRTKRESWLKQLLSRSFKGDRRRRRTREPRKDWVRQRRTRERRKYWVRRCHLQVSFLRRRRRNRKACVMLHWLGPLPAKFNLTVILKFKLCFSFLLFVPWQVWCHWMAEQMPSKGLHHWNVRSVSPRSFLHIHTYFTQFKFQWMLLTWYDMLARREIGEMVWAVKWIRLRKKIMPSLHSVGRQEIITSCQKDHQAFVWQRLDFREHRVSSPLTTGCLVRKKCTAVCPLIGSMGWPGICSKYHLGHWDRKAGMSSGKREVSWYRGLFIEHAAEAVQIDLTGPHLGLMV